MKNYPTNLTDTQYAAFEVITPLSEKFDRIKKIYADYIGQLVGNVKFVFGYDMEVTLRSDKSTDFKPLPKRWVVKRTFSGLENFRGFAKDYEFSVKSSTAMIYMADDQWSNGLNKFKQFLKQLLYLIKSFRNKTLNLIRQRFYSVIHKLFRVCLKIFQMNFEAILDQLFCKAAEDLAL